MTPNNISSKNFANAQRLCIASISVLFILSGCSYIPFVGNDDAEDVEAKQVEAKQAPVDINSTKKREGQAYSDAQQYKMVTNPKLINSEYWLNEQKAGGHPGVRQREAEKNKNKNKELNALKEEISELKEAVITLKSEEDKGGYNYRQQPVSNSGGASCRKEDVDYYLEKGFTTEQITQICSVVVQ